MPKKYTSWPRRSSSRPRSSTARSAPPFGYRNLFASTTRTSQAPLDATASPMAPCRIIREEVGPAAGAASDLERGIGDVDQATRVAQRFARRLESSHDRQPVFGRRARTLALLDA